MLYGQRHKISKTYWRNWMWLKVVMVQDPSRGGKRRLQMWTETRSWVACSKVIGHTHRQEWGNSAGSTLRYNRNLTAIFTATALFGTITISHMDYGSNRLPGLTVLDSLQPVLTTAAIVFWTQANHVTPPLKTLQWLPFVLSVQPKFLQFSLGLITI